MLKADFLSGCVRRAFADLWSRLDDSEGASASSTEVMVKERSDVLTLVRNCEFPRESEEKSSFLEDGRTEIPFGPQRKSWQEFLSDSLPVTRLHWWWCSGSTAVILFISRSEKPSEAPLGGQSCQHGQQRLRWWPFCCPNNVAAQQPAWKALLSPTRRQS